MWFPTILITVLLVEYSYQQETLRCTNGTTQCFNGAQKYFRCPSTGIYEITKIAENSYDCPTENSVQLRCLDTVKTGQKSAADTLNALATTGPCLQITCFGAGVFGAGAINVGACGTYYACSAAAVLPTIINCSPGQHFNNVTLKCEAAATAGCDPSLITTAAPTTTIATTTFQTTTTQPPVPSCSGPGKIADPTSCRRYYKCGIFSVEPMSKQCLFNQRFDEAAGRCAREVDCGTRPDVD